MNACFGRLVVQGHGDACSHSKQTVSLTPMLSAEVPMGSDSVGCYKVHLMNAWIMRFNTGSSRPCRLAKTVQKCWVNPATPHDQMHQLPTTTTHAPFQVVISTTHSLYLMATLDKVHPCRAGKLVQAIGRC